ncbi:predicted protein [Postia placenta Mad-698-R]|uniref:Pentatricopeptide repeat-containing protein-mitochondrial domain-containing protein n=1 Tax=Postia placenta MAD-698-R-SB12 TaxID=670580 RepID=A0A1X6MSV8_9APHY|nr:hypothetical protein POSPLADRAFT_1150225 [Postia placenta MAD-698-R-SB12]EED79057.1 predicted protein [Postia placenta Mad-698-R]OSX59457.1 hypothetical protein POSPLADRAFT_1150225 [Postia placenta MAD-698-R-SB12]
MPAYQLLDYGTRIAQTVERMRHDRDVVEELRLWGGRLLTLIDRTAPRIKQFDLTEGLLRQRCLVVTGLAMTGQLDEAVEALRQVEEMPKLPRTISHVIRTFTAVALSVHQYRGSQDVLRFIIDEWDYVGTYLERTSVILSADKVTALSGSRFRRHVYNIVSEIEKPVTLLQDMEKRWSNHTRELAGSLLIESLCYAEMGHDALDVLDYMKLQSLRVRPEQRLAVVLALVQSDAFQLANRLYQDIISFMTTGSLYDRYLSTGLHLYAHQGDVARAEEFYSKLAHRGQAGIRQKTLFMHAHAVRGDSARVVELFRHIFPQDESSQPRPGVIQYTTVIYAHAQAGDMAGMTQWLDAMADAGIKHDNQLYDIILKSFATRGEVVFMSELLDRMRAAGILPGKESYTTIIALLARRNDPIAAEEVFKRALQEGVTPDRRMITTLMNAYVESGQWHGVVRTFDYITASAHRGIRLSLEVFNTLLKAYVLIGAPFRIVAGVFQRLEQARVRPDAYTFALLIQSACDSGLLEIAQDLLAEMDRLAARWQSNLHINLQMTFTGALYIHCLSLHMRIIPSTLPAEGINVGSPPVKWKKGGCNGIVAQLTNSRTMETTFDEAPFIDTVLVEGPGRSQYASFTFEDLNAIAPWLEAKQIIGPSLDSVSLLPDLQRDLRHRTLVPWHLFHSTTVAIPHANVPLIEVGSLQAALALSIISDVVAILGFGFDSGPVA